MKFTTKVSKSKSNEITKKDENILDPISVSKKKLPIKSDFIKRVDEKPFPTVLLVGIIFVVLSAVALLLVMLRKNIRKSKAEGAGKSIVPDTTMSTFNTNSSVHVG